MGKKQHQKDKLYLTANEWSSFYGGKKKDDKSGCAFKKLPFYCCSLSLQPFETPLATAEGLVFDLLHVVPYIKKYGRNPATGKPLVVKDLIKLNYHKNCDGKYHCPVTFKVFNENSHIVAVRTSGNVYSFEAIDRLNLKTRNMKDLISDESFSRSDLLTLQDPAHPEKLDFSTFYHVKNKSDSVVCGKTSASTVRQMNPETKATMEALAEEFSNDCKKGAKLLDKKSAGDNSDEDLGRSLCSHQEPSKTAHYSLGRVSTGFTSTVMLPHTINEADKSAHAIHSLLTVPIDTSSKSNRTEYDMADLQMQLLKIATGFNIPYEHHVSLCQHDNGFGDNWSMEASALHGAVIDHATLLYQTVCKKGYVRLHTSVGEVNLELHCGIVQKTCHNFIQLCKRGYYNQTTFHRSIRNFMIQGGDPSGSGKGGQSVWKKPFKDEFKPNLAHNGRGVLSMANSGPNTNKSQFFITYRSCRHLDGKHTVFGRVVGGIQVLTEMEKVPTDSSDKPMESIVITKATVFVDPFEETELKLIEDSKILRGSFSTTDTQDMCKKSVSISTKVGKYISNKSGTGTVKRFLPTESTSTHKKPKHNKEPT